MKQFILASLIVLFATPGAEARQKPEWLTNTPIVLVSNHDSMPIFRNRVGGNTTYQLEEYEREHSEEAIIKLKELGVTVVILHFYKGFGLAAEREHQEKALKMAALVRKHGMRVGVYVGSTIAYETFLAEKPDAAEWFAPDYIGRPVFYMEQTFRKRAYFMHPGYREYMRRVLTMAEEEFHADLIHFDNTSMQAEPSIFQHPLAITQFREFLNRKYTKAQLEQRFGFSETRFILPPRYDKPLGAINDPLFQEWADFRCVQLTAYYKEMDDLLRGLNPQVAVETNPHSGISGRNTVWEQGVDYPRLLANMDAVWTEEGDPAGISPNGTLISKIRTFKMASILNNTLFVGTGGVGENTLQMAESLAFNRQSIGDVGGTLAGYDLPAVQRRWLKFFHRNFDHYRDVENIADVAVLHSFASMAFNNDRPAVSTMLFEQALIEAKVPFDIIFDDNLKDLSKYKVLVLADQEALNDDKLELIRGFVRHGGGLVATDLTSNFDEWRRRRRAPGLQDLYQGRAIYIPEVKPAVIKPLGVRTTNQYWKMPLNATELIAAVKRAAGGRLSLEVIAPRTVVAEPMRQQSNNRLLVHLVNYNVARTPLVRDIQVSLALPPGAKVRSVDLLAPEQEASVKAPHQVANGRVSFTVPQLATYRLATIQLETTR
ncbi:MAG: beta-galactosidase trimerization domain-containing protein [Acidobacteria bacterium]|nr:beta-galactosidase trimerization domain-containing protein [Acidobacteriota bacterium]